MKETSFIFIIFRGITVTSWHKAFLGDQPCKDRVHVQHFTHWESPNFRYEFCIDTAHVVGRCCFSLRLLSTGMWHYGLDETAFFFFYIQVEEWAVWGKMINDTEEGGQGLQ